MNTTRTLAHFASIPLAHSSGMGRVALHWRDAFVRRGWFFNNYGIEKVPMPTLKPFWANSASSVWKRDGASEDLLLAHEPVAEVLRQSGCPTVLFSHGLEARGAEIESLFTTKSYKGVKSFITQPIWQMVARQRERALQKCPLLLLINEDDKNDAITRYGRRTEDIFVFRNGVNLSSLTPNLLRAEFPTVLFYGSWLERKGKFVLINAAQKLASAGIKVKWLLVGTGKSEAEVLLDWPLGLRSSVEILPYVSPTDDDLIYSRATLFVLPSFYEGQPLTLLQAMESGICVITSRCCGQKDIINNSHNGFLFEPGNSEELAQLIAKTLANDNLRFKIGLQAKLDMASRTWPVVADEVVDRIDEFAKSLPSYGSNR